MPGTAQEQTIDERISSSDADRGGTVAPDAPMNAPPPITATPSQADPGDGKAVSVDIEPVRNPAEESIVGSSRKDAPSEVGAGEESTIDLTAQDVPLSSLLGMTARREDGTEIGTVEDIVVSLHTERIVSVVIGSGGILGIGGSTERVPIARVAIDASGQAIVVSSDGDGG